MFTEEISEPVETLSSNLAFIVAPTALGLVCAVIGTYLWIRRRQIRKHRLALKKAKEGGILQAVNPFYKTNGSLCPNETSALLVDDYEVDWAWFKVGPCLGEGAFGKVLRADLRDGFVLNKARPETKTFAVKVLRDFPTEEERRNLLLEIEFMKELGQHRNIVNINGCCTIASDVRLIMDYCPLGDLRNYLRRCRQEEYIAKQRFVHRDLAARNVLVCADKSIKISDFGLTRDVYQNNVWSFAVVLWEIVTLGGFPYPGIPDKDLFRLLKDGYRMERPSNCSLEVYQLMLACWHPHPIDRPSFTDLRSKLETMLEATQAYIDLKVNLNEDYFLHSDSR
ncbi:fibroblast growth factor receptor 2-like [Liolophura sinensis]|uniref:fibroblast growth factor receptor 2-like n=1 Tax=Liolophura sinensis TaxID=3198878 RepID=UPI0031599414